MIILTILTLGLVLYFYSIRCLDAPISNSVRFALTASRLIFLSLLLFLLTLPHIREVMKLSTAPILYVALDDSLSMGFPADPPSSEGGKSPSRWDTVIHQLNEGGLMERWKRKGFDLRFMPFSQALSNSPTERASWLSQLPQSATPSYAQTHLAASIDRFSEAVSPDEPAYLLLFTDGRWNQGRNPIAAAAQLASVTRNFRSQIYTFGIGTVASVRDVIVDHIQLPSVARSGESIQLRAHLLVRGVEMGTPLMVRMRGETQDGDPIVEQDQNIVVESESDERTVSFDLPLLDKGQYLFTVQVEPLAGEWIVSNNRLVQGMTIRDAKDRVLLLTSAPDWEFKYLKRVLEDQETLDVQAYFVHDNNLMALGDREWIAKQADISRDSEDSKNYATLQELQEDFARWPVVILHNYAFSIEQLDFARRLKTYIEEGGGLLFLPGSHESADLPPILLDALAAPLAASFTPKTQAVMVQFNADPDSPFAQILHDEPELNLPPLGEYRIARSRSDSGKVLVQGLVAMNESVPLVTLHRYGLGRIVVLGSLSFWRLNLLSGKDVLTPFWLTALYQGCPRLHTQSGEIQIDGYLFNVFDSVRIAYHKGNRIGDATDSAVALTVDSPSRRETVWLAPTGGASGVNETRYTPTEAGIYQVATLTQDASAAFRVENTALEMRDLRQNIEDLRELAQITGGEYANQPAWRALADRLPVEAKIVREERSRFLGEKWWMASLLILFLGFEWFLRWMKGLP